MAKKTKKYSINWDDKGPVSFEVNSVEYETLDDVPEDDDRLRLEAMLNSAEDAEFDAEFEKMSAQPHQGEGVPIEKIILSIFTGVAVLMLLITAIASVNNVRKINREESAPGRVVDVKMERSYVSEEDRVVEEYYYPVVQFVASDGRSRTVQLSEGSLPPSYDVGDDVTILYEPENPNDARIQSFSSSAGMWILPVITGILGIGLHVAVLAVVYVMYRSENFLPPRTGPARKPLPGRRTARPLSAHEVVYRALVFGTRDYVRKTGFRSAVIGLSGGVDSALVAAVAAEALGKEHVTGVFMPSPYSSRASREDAAVLAANLGIRFLEIPIKQTFDAYLATLRREFANTKQDVTEENLQARIRGNLLMALSNKLGWLVPTTGNKSEMSVGYATLYGDMAGGFAVIKDVPKTLVYGICRHVNRAAGRAVIPKRVLTKAPTAELRPNQKDSDSLPVYPVVGR